MATVATVTVTAATVTMVMVTMVTMKTTSRDDSQSSASNLLKYCVQSQTILVMSPRSSHSVKKFAEKVICR